MAVYEALTKEDLVGNAARIGAYLLNGLRAAFKDNSTVVEIRGLGLLIGVELDRPCKELVERAREQGLLINVTADNVIRLVPPLTLSQSEADFIISVISKLVQEL